MAKKLRYLVLLSKYMVDPKESLWKKILFFLPAVYFLVPFDLLPDIIFPFGYLEDFGLLIIGWQWTVKELEKYWQRLQSEKPQNQQKKGKVIDLKKDDYTTK